MANTLGEARGLPYPQKLKAGWSITVNELEAAKDAIEHGLDPNTLWTEEDLLKPAPKSGCVEQHYIEDSATWPHYNTPLHRAIHFGEFGTAEYLLQHGADVDLYNAIGRTPLHEAVANQKHEAIRFLLGHNVDVNKSTLGACVRYEDGNRDIHGSEGDLCLKMALSISDLTSMQLLVDAEVDLCPPSQHPWTALDLALLSSDRRIMDLLQAQGSNLPIGRSTRGSSSAENGYREASRDLLAFTGNGDVVPPKELYDAYLFVLDMIDEVTSANVDILIQKFFEVLHQTADQIQHSQNRRICTSCKNFQLGARSIHEKKTAFEFELHQNRKCLDDSANNGCLLCSIIADALDQDESNMRSRPRVSDGQRNHKSDRVQLSMPYPDHLRVSCDDLETYFDVSRVDDPLICRLENDDGPDTSTGSPNAMKVAKWWLQSCQSDENHNECQKVYHTRQQSTILPRRLLQVGTSQSQPRIVEVQDIPVPYCALSYCWGAKDFFITTRNNLAQNMTGIAMESFPAVMRDAISVVRSLEYEYIWIDALCIVQDDQKDWAREAAIMGAVYSNAELTISTLVGSDCHTGLFQPRTVRKAHPVLLDIWEPKYRRRANTSMAVMPEWLQSELGIHGPVHSRGWTLQEQLLSTRILYFGDGILHWECLHHYVDEADPNANYIRGYDYRSLLEGRCETKRAIHGAASVNLLRRRQEPFELWKQQVEEFTKKSLTNPSDRLPAFDSISKSLASALGSNPVWGVWDGEKLLESLCWKVQEPLSSPPGTISNIPSWTWVAVTGEVSFYLTNRTGREDVQPSSSTSVVSIKAGATGASITLKGTLHRKRPLDSSIFKSWEELSEDGIILDRDVGNDQDVYTFETLTFPRGLPYKGYGYPRWPRSRPPETLRLLLQKVENGSNTFRRIGIWRAYEEPVNTLVHGEDSEMGVKPVDHAIMTPMDWLVTNEETLINQEFILV